MGKCHMLGPIVLTEDSVFVSVAKGSFPGKDQASHLENTFSSKRIRKIFFQGVTILIDLESFDAGLSRTSTAGATVSHFYYKYIPVLSQSGINIQPGTSTELGVTTQVVETTEVAKRRFTPEERQCYFEDEIRMVREAILNKKLTLACAFSNLCENIFC